MDEMFTEKTVAADPYTDPVDQEPAQGAANPYEQGQQPQYQQPQYQQPQYQPPQYQQPQYQPPQYGQPQYGQPQYGQPQYQQPLYQPQQYQQMYPQYPAYRKPVQGGGAAKAFAIVSFVAGCIALFILMMMLMFSTPSTGDFLRSRSTRSAFAAIALTYGTVISVPGLIFGIVAMAKKTNKFTFALLGIIFSASLLLFGVAMLLTL